MSEIINNSDLEKVVGGAGGWDHAAGKFVNYGNYIVYTIEPDDYLMAIANRFGVTVAQIQQWNNIKNRDLIYAGNTLTIYPTVIR